MSRFLTVEKFFSIPVSRPGYLNTLLHDTNRFIDDEAHLLAAILIELDVSSVGILTWSGGGAAAYRLAACYPERVSSIVAIAAVSSRWVAPSPDAAQRFLFGTRIGEHVISFLTRHLPGQVIGGALESEGCLRGDSLRRATKQVMAAPEQRRLVLETAKTMNIGGRRSQGWYNDISNFASIESLELERIKCPVLLIHGDADTDAPLEHSRFAHSQLSNSELVEVEDGTHLAFYAHPRAPEVQEMAITWFLHNSIEAGTVGA